MDNLVFSPPSSFPVPRMVSQNCYISGSNGPMDVVGKICLNMRSAELNLIYALQR